MRYCVIAPALSTKDRFWFATEQEAADHAAKLLNKNGFTHKELVVVQARSVVSPIINPVKVSRDLHQLALAL